MGTSTAAKVGERTRSTRGLFAVSLTTLRWLSLALPAGFLIVFDYLRHFVFPFYMFHDWPGFLIIWGGILAAAFAFSHVVFRNISKMQGEILQRNRELSTLHRAAYRQAEQLRALHEASMALAAELSPEAVLQKVVDLSRKLVEARYGALAVFEPEKKERLITSGLDSTDKERITAVRRGLGIMAAVPDHGKPLRLADIRTHPLFNGFPPNHPEMHTFLGVPILSKGQVIGNLRLTNKAGAEQFTQEDEDIVVMLAAQAAIAIENARLYEQEQVLAILQERERIAQDLHDGIIQDIYAIGLGLEQCIEQQGLPARLSERLSRAVDHLNDIIKDIRNYIFALEPTDLQGHDLVAGVENMTHEFRVNSLIEAELLTEGDVNGALTQEQVGQVLHIIHEALTNVLKHARASAVTVSIKQNADTLELSVVDNGSGFDPSKMPRSGLGLRNIAERSKAMGADFAIDSARDRGCKLSIVIPIRTFTREGSQK